MNWRLLCHGLDRVVFRQPAKKKLRRLLDCAPFGRPNECWLRVVVIYLMVATASMTSLADTDPRALSGVVLDRSISLYGKRFHNQFALLWAEAGAGLSAPIAVREAVVPRSGTVLWVEVQRQKVYQTGFGRRGTGPLERSVLDAVAAVQRYLVIENAQNQSPDLWGDGY